MTRFAIPILAILALGCGVGSESPTATAPTELELSAAKPASTGDFHVVAFTAQPPEYLPWSGIRYSWTVSATNCVGGMLSCEFTWNIYDHNLNSLYPYPVCQSNTFYINICSVTVPASYGSIRARVSVTSGNGTGDSGFSPTRWASNACVPNVTGADNVYTEGSYNYGLSFTGSTSTNCTDINYTWSGYTGGNGSTSSAYYYICPYTYTAPSEVTMTSKGYSKTAYKTVTVWGSGSLPCPE